jgi:hypothetical protein
MRKKQHTGHIPHLRERPPFIHWRYLNSLAYPISITSQPFLEKRATDATQVERIQQARLKAALSRVTLWSQLLSA